MSRAYTMTLALLPALLLLLVMSVEVSMGQGAGGGGAAAGAGGADGFAAQAADVIDNTLLNFKNGINTLFEDSSKIGSFFANVTTHFKKLTGQDKQAAT